MEVISIHPFVARAQRLSPAPIVMVKLLDLFSHDEHDVAQIIHTIKNDPVLTANVLALCNSAMIRGSNSVDTLEEAVIRLGINQIQRKVMTLYAGKLLSCPKIAAYKENQLWEHSLATAIASKQIASARALEENQAFTVGLLHDLGKIVIIQSVPQYEEILDQATTHQIPLCVAETNRLGISHAELGYQLLHQWKVPADVSETIKAHHYPVDATSAVVYLGNYIAHQLSKQFGAAILNPEDLHRTAGTLDLSDEAILEISQSTREELEREKASLQTSFCKGL